MYTALILGIIDKLLDIVLQLIKDMPADQKAAAWAQHQRNLEFWQGLLDRLKIGEPRAE